MQWKSLIYFSTSNTISIIINFDVIYIHQKLLKIIKLRKVVNCFPFFLFPVFPLFLQNPLPSILNLFFALYTPFIVFYYYILQIMTSQRMYDRTFGETIRHIRENKGMLLRQVAAALEIDTALISKIERGERTAQKEQVSKIATILEVPEEELMIIWLSYKILTIVEEEPMAYKALKQTEKRITKN